MLQGAIRFLSPGRAIRTQRRDLFRDGTPCDGVATGEAVGVAATGTVLITASSQASRSP